jgi:phage I-like protein
LVSAAKKYKIDTSGFEQKYLSDDPSPQPSPQGRGGTGTVGEGDGADPAGSARRAEALRHPTSDDTAGTAVLRIPKYLRAIQLDSLPVAVLRDDGTELYEIPIAVTGTWVKNDREFSITTQDLADIVKNFEKRKNQHVVIDYEHASEMPEIARGGPIPAAGWIHSLCANGGLKAMIEWTPDSQEMIKKGQYRFFSPAIDWAAKDKETGEPQGATLTSGALTNHPFLEELPPITLSDLVIAAQSSGFALEGSGSSPKGARCQVPGKANLKPAVLQEMAGIHQDGFMQGVSVAAGGGKPQGGEMKKLSLKKLAERGRRAVCDDAGDQLGEFSLDELDLDEVEFEELMSRRGARMDDTLSDVLSEVGLRESSGEELRRLLKPARQLGVERVERAARAALLSETLRDGAINLDVAAKLAEQGRLGFSDFRAVQKAQDLVEKAIDDGKFLPADREFISRVALSEPERFEAWTKKKPRSVQLGGPSGVSGPAPESLAQDLSMRLSELMREKNLSRQKALQELAQNSPELIRRWRWGRGNEARS